MWLCIMFVDVTEWYDEGRKDGSQFRCSDIHECNILVAIHIMYKHIYMLCMCRLDTDSQVAIYSNLENQSDSLTEC
jgi:hypothetical protein